ncbi:hypothetical protein ASG75_09600 [Rhodanobacter sp. Soil772]|nr:hypothetical protein ASG75_09600 [Rhodanobacter sp. Soil772]
MLGLAPLAVQAQQASDAPAAASTAPSVANAINLNRITVTAQKREQQVADVPISISAYSNDFMQRFGISDVETLSRYVPGVQVQVQSPNNPGIAVRGITTDDGAATAATRVSIFQDGVDISRSRGSMVALFDMDRVEVLRGPQGTLFGRGAESGAISLIQNKAQAGNAGGFQAEFGNFSSRKLTGYLNTPISDNVYARVAVHHAHHDGYIENLSGGRLSGEDTNAIRASLHFNVGSGSGVDLIANYQRDAPPGTDFRSATVPNRHGSTDVYGAADLDHGDELGLRRKVYGLTAIGDFALSDDWRLSSTTGLRKFNSLEKFDADGSQVNMLNFAEHSKSHQLSQELRLNYDAGGNFTGFFGANYFYENGSQGVPFGTDERSLLLQLLALAPTLDGLSDSTRQLIALLGPPPPLLDANNMPNQPYSAIPLLGVPLNTDEREGYTNYGRSRSYEMFADGTWHLNDRFDLTGGLRVTREEQAAGYQVSNASPASGIGSTLALFGAGFNGITGPNNLFVPTNGRLSNNSSSTSVVGRLIGSFHVNDSTNSYLSVSRGRRPNVLAFNVNAAGNGYDKVVLPAETIMSYELGLKGEANGGRFAYDLSAFYYDYNNFQSQAFQGGRLLQLNAGRASVPGFEASLQQAFSDRFSGFVNYSYLRARFADKDNQGREQAYAGNHLRLAPDHTLAVGVQWNQPLANGRNLYVRPSYTWRSRIYFEDDNNPAYAQPAYGLLNLRAGVTFDKGRWDLAVWGANLLDKKYLMDAGNVGENFNLGTYIPGAPRTFGISISGKF